MRTPWMALGGIALLISACYSQTPPPQSPESNPLDDAPPAAAKTAETGSSSSAPTDEAVDPASRKGKFDEQQVHIVLARAAKGAHDCVDIAGPDQPHGDATASITFSGSGHSVKASVPPPYDGTPIGQCVVRAFDGLIVPPFDGDDRVVDQPVDLKPSAKPAAKTPAKKK